MHVGNFFENGLLHVGDFLSNGLLYVGNILGCGLLHFGNVLGCGLLHFGNVLGSGLLHFGNFFGCGLLHFGNFLGSGLLHIDYIFDDGRFFVNRDSQNGFFCYSRFFRGSVCCFGLLGIFIFKVGRINKIINAFAQCFCGCHYYLAGRVKLVLTARVEYRFKLVEMVDGLFDLRVIFVKIDIVPYKEYINRPNAAAVVLFAAVVTVEPADKRLGVEELLGGFALESSLNYVVVLFIFKPYARGNGEAELLFFCGRLGHVPRGCLAQGVLGVLLVDSKLGRKL